MAKGILYIMTTVVPGLIKIGKTGSDNFEQRMYILEHNGYCNVTGLKRSYAIEVDAYDEKEKLLHQIFEKSKVGDTELFSVDQDIVKQLLSSFDGTSVYPQDESKEQVFIDAVDSSNSKLIPDGEYTFEQVKQSDNRTVKATAVIENSCWKLLKGSVLGVTEGQGVSVKARSKRILMPIGADGTLKADVNLGTCTPSFAGTIVLNASNNGWFSWKDRDGNFVDKYRKSKLDNINSDD